MPPRGTGTTASAAPSSRSDQDAAGPDSGEAEGLPMEHGTAIIDLSGFDLWDAIQAASRWRFSKS